MADWKDILSDKDEQSNEDELIKYVNGDLSEEEKYAFEKNTADSAFMNDAVDGLSNFENKKDLREYVDQLNRNLNKQLEQRKKRKQKRKLKDNPWLTISIVIILVLAVLAFIAIRMYRDDDFLKPSTENSTIIKTVSSYESI